MPLPSLSVAIPTYQREAVLVETLRSLAPLIGLNDELLIVDQTQRHTPETDKVLGDLQQAGKLVWIRAAEASITRAMNTALLQAKGEVVVFLDDDITPDRELLERHRAVHAQLSDVSWLVAGRVIQPWQEGVDYAGDEQFHFASLQQRETSEFMGGNFSLRRADAIALGGFDTNFVRVAYRFEAEFAWRWRMSGRRIRYEPSAVIHHLKVSSGGTRAFGEHLTTTRPDHSVGAYYFFMRTQTGISRTRLVIERLMRSIATRHHLGKPWWIPLTLVAELRGLLWALKLQRRGPGLLTTPPACGDQAPRPC